MKKNNNQAESKNKFEQKNSWSKSRADRIPGKFAGKIIIPDDFDAPSEEIEKLFYQD